MTLSSKTSSAHRIPANRVLIEILDPHSNPSSAEIIRLRYAPQGYAITTPLEDIDNIDGSGPIEYGFNGSVRYSIPAESFGVQGSNYQDLLLGEEGIPPGMPGETATPKLPFQIPVLGGDVPSLPGRSQTPRLLPSGTNPPIPPGPHTTHVHGNPVNVASPPTLNTIWNFSLQQRLTVAANSYEALRFIIEDPTYWKKIGLEFSTDGLGRTQVTLSRTPTGKLPLLKSFQVPHAMRSDIAKQIAWLLKHDHIRAFLTETGLRLKLNYAHLNQAPDAVIGRFIRQAGIRDIPPGMARTLFRGLGLASAIGFAYQAYGMTSLVHQKGEVVGPEAYAQTGNAIGEQSLQISASLLGFLVGRGIVNYVATETVAPVIPGSGLIGLAATVTGATAGGLSAVAVTAWYEANLEQAVLSNLRTIYTNNYTFGERYGPLGLGREKHPKDRIRYLTLLDIEAAVNRARQTGQNLAVSLTEAADSILTSEELGTLFADPNGNDPRAHLALKYLYRWAGTQGLQILSQRWVSQQPDPMAAVAELIALLKGLIGQNEIELAKQYKPVLDTLISANYPPAEQAAALLQLEQTYVAMLRANYEQRQKDLHQAHGYWGQELKVLRDAAREEANEQRPEVGEPLLSGELNRAYLAFVNWTTGYFGDPAGSGLQAYRQQTEALAVAPKVKQALLTLPMRWLGLQQAYGHALRAGVMKLPEIVGFDSIPGLEDAIKTTEQLFALEARLRSIADPEAQYEAAVAYLTSNPMSLRLFVAALDRIAQTLGYTQAQRQLLVEEVDARLEKKQASQLEDVYESHK